MKRKVSILLAIMLVIVTMLIGCGKQPEDGDELNVTTVPTSTVSPTAEVTPTAETTPTIRPDEQQITATPTPKLSADDLRATLFPELVTPSPVVDEGQKITPTEVPVKPTITPTNEPTQGGEIVSRPTDAPKPTEKPTATPTPKPTEKPTATPTPKPTSVPTSQFSGKANVYYNSTSINATVYIGGKSLTGKNSRDAVCVGDKVTDDMVSWYDNTLRDGYQWCVVHFTVDINNNSVGYGSDCIPDIVIRSSTGKKLNSESTVYYVTTNDSNGVAYKNDERYDKEYDLIFQLPKGVNTFQLQFGRQISTVFEFTYTGQKVTSLISY